MLASPTCGYLWGSPQPFEGAEQPPPAPRQGTNPSALIPPSPRRYRGARIREGAATPLEATGHNRQPLGAPAARAGGGGGGSVLASSPPPHGPAAAGTGPRPPPRSPAGEGAASRAPPPAAGGAAAAPAPRAAPVPGGGRRGGTRGKGGDPRQAGPPSPPLSPRRRGARGGGRGAGWGSPGGTEPAPVPRPPPPPTPHTHTHPRAGTPPARDGASELPPARQRPRQSDTLQSVGKDGKGATLATRGGWEPAGGLGAVALPACLPAAGTLLDYAYS